MMQAAVTARMKSQFGAASWAFFVFPAVGVAMSFLGDLPLVLPFRSALKARFLNQFHKPGTPCACSLSERQTAFCHQVHAFRNIRFVHQYMRWVAIPAG
jgi:hypothetical protein